jgi:hypothetical protein
MGDSLTTNTEQKKKMKLAIIIGAAKEVAACGLPEIKDNPLAGTPGLASIRRYLAEGWQTQVF